MTSEYTHGHEYDTYHYEDKKHKPLHFTVTRPEVHDVVVKGAYYHAYPHEVGPSYSHHDTHYYQTEYEAPVYSSHHYAVPEGEHHSRIEYELRGDHFGHATRKAALPMGDMQQCLA